MQGRRETPYRTRPAAFDARKRGKDKAKQDQSRGKSKSRESQNRGRGSRKRRDAEKREVKRKGKEKRQETDARGNLAAAAQRGLPLAPGRGGEAGCPPIPKARAQAPGDASSPGARLSSASAFQNFPNFTLLGVFTNSEACYNKNCEKRTDWSRLHRFYTRKGDDSICRQTFKASGSRIFLPGRGVFSDRISTFSLRVL